MEKVTIFLFFKPMSSCESAYEGQEMAINYAQEKAIAANRRCREEQAKLGEPDLAKLARAREALDEILKDGSNDAIDNVLYAVKDGFIKGGSVSESPTKPTPVENYLYSNNSRPKTEGQVAATEFLRNHLCSYSDYIEILNSKQEASPLVKTVAYMVEQVRYEREYRMANGDMNALDEKYTSE
ncbi:hypothetical protein COT52_01010 [candidate division WWE3 bacterium CG08_land_8_20_14_0_20_43_13]|uniref:Uncharacterized protein n=2 Tax=Bacteria candidate phyla TaxID=1783234 RepID=A0A2H0X7S8_UNCKA|nr:MAG: hypothetical protein COT52_01010 [candidate division WWE3 bacterium CG08_land_8_20_14_0_20_43_13]